MPNHATLLKQNQDAILADWTGKLESRLTRLSQVTTREERARLSTDILDAFVVAAQTGDLNDVEGSHYEGMRRLLNTLSIDFAERGLTPSETAGYIFSLKESIFDVYQRALPATELAVSIWDVNQGLDRLGLFTFETFSLARERIIKSQAQALTELSTPVIQVWEGIIALPLVGSIDSIRAKEIMEKLLEAVVAQEADVVIIDITGVPVVDTQVANRLMRTVEAVRLLGTSSIITGINPVIAQTLVQLGVDLSQLSTKSSLRAGLQQAFKDMRIKVSRQEGKR
ncbi:RsbT co-antagonist protein RsbRA [compost metagenome]